MKTSQEFIKLETWGANLLLGATLLALLISNSPWHDYYENFLQRSNLLQFLINEGLMTIFFLVVGLEIKYELLEGTLNSFSKAVLPGFAAIGGMLIPALIYISFNRHNRLNLQGWAIPTATDIAFSLGILAFLRGRFAAALKVFLTALAIFDDLAAIVIIALFYTSHLSLLYLGLSLVCLVILCILNFAGIRNLIFYSMVGLILWFCLLHAGVHPTLAGVILAFLVPVHRASSHSFSPSPLHKLMRLTHPIVALVILPLFAFANAGISFLNISISTLDFSIVWGILLSLFIGKQAGVFMACRLAVKLGIARLPEQVRWSELYGIAIICGVGFTISLFIGTLAFGGVNDAYLNSVKVGVLGGSFLSGVVGYLTLYFLHKCR